jgi:glucose-6-phosphate 1-dehydrogenase
VTDSIATLVLLGASGDLASRLLLPALGQLLTAEPRRRIQLVGAGAEDLSNDQWRDRVRGVLGDASGDAVDDLLARTRYQKTDVTAVEPLRGLLSACDQPMAIYFALPPAVTAKACRTLAKVGVDPRTALALEKPFGINERSAHELDQVLAGIVAERQVHRVDHFLGRTDVLNLLGWRFANSIFEPVWDARSVESVEIVFDEQLGLENRARYYDHAGALVDMIQSHLLQVLALFAMEPPATLTERDLRDAKGAVLRATRVWGGDAAGSSRRARYTAGRVGDREYPNYLDEPGVDPANDTETLAEVVLEVATWRWAGVPFRLRSGKALGERRREIRVVFRPPARVPDGLEGPAPGNVLRIQLGPERVALEVNLNGPGDPETLSREVLSVEFDPGRLPAYGEVLRGVLDGDAALSIRGDTAEQCWRIVEPVLDAWRAGTVPMAEYRAGSDGGPATLPSPRAPRGRGDEDRTGGGTRSV